MAREMEQVIRYKCKWCGREFRTNRLHCCKFDPDAKNCMSCKHIGCHHKGFIEFGESFPPSFECDITGTHNEGGLNDYPYCVATDVNRTTKCDNWEIMDNYKGVKTFVEHMRKVEDKNLEE